MSEQLSLKPFSRDGLELVIDTNTGASYVPGYRALARICSLGLDKPIHQERVKRYVSSLVEGVTTPLILEAEAFTAGGKQGVTLIPESLIAKTIRKFNEKLAEKIDEAGTRIFMHTLAGYKIHSKEQPTDVEGHELLDRAISGFAEDLVPRALPPKVEALTVVMLGSEYMTIEGFLSCFDKVFSPLEYTTLFHEMMVDCLDRGIEVPTIATVQKIEHLFPIEILTQHHK